MSTWIEIEMETRGGQPWHRERVAVTPPVPARSFNERCGTGPHTFSQRLSRARILYLRRNELVANWLALALVCVLVVPTFRQSVGQSDFSAAEARGFPDASPHGNSFHGPVNEARALQSMSAAYR
jgi:hypothetical protein